jgi:hypothetical protein
MRRTVGLIAAGLGAFLLVSGLLLRFYVAGQVVKFPLNEYQVTTLHGTNVTYFSPARLKDVTGVKMRVTRTIEGDVAAGTSSRAVWTLFSYTYDATNGVAYKTLTQRSAFDRRSGALADCCGAAVGSYTGRQSGLSLTWPIGTRRQSYQVFDTPARPTLTACAPTVSSSRSRPRNSARRSCPGPWSACMASPR